MEYNDCLQLAVALGKTYKQSQEEWTQVNEMNPVWCQIITNYTCTCDGLIQLHTETKGREIQPEQGVSG